MPKACSLIELKASTQVVVVNKFCFKESTHIIKPQCLDAWVGSVLTRCRKLCLDVETVVCTLWCGVVSIINTAREREGLQVRGGYTKQE